MVLRPALFACCLIFASVIGSAGDAAAVEAPFESRLMRLAEVLGSLHYLRNLCGENGNHWREQMEKLLEAEKPDAARRAKFIANFNRGYRSFDNIYVSCTRSAAEAINRYMKEGEALSREIAVRYGN